VASLRARLALRVVVVQTLRLALVVVAKRLALEPLTAEPVVLATTQQATAVTTPALAMLVMLAM